MDQNPYKSPRVVEPGKKREGLSTGRMAAAIVLGLLTIPAVGIAFFTTCLATFGVTGFDSATPDAPLIVGTIFGALAAAGMIALIVRITRRPSR